MASVRNLRRRFACAITRLRQRRGVFSDRHGHCGGTLGDVADELHGPFHRMGEPGGPGAVVAALSVEGRGPDGALVPADLLDAQGDASEVELLRTVCGTLGIQWGHDDLGWWAVVPRRLTDK